jgi:HK97 family phage prohead protease
MKAVFNTEELNSYGFWVLTSGIDLARFEKNPVVTYMHNTYEMSVGKITDLRIEGQNLVGEVEFDEDDELGRKLKGKYEKGYMSGFSIGFRALTWSDMSEHLKQGQERPTVLACELMEIAVATVPSNASAVKLYDTSGVVVNLSAVDDINKLVPKIKIKTDMKEIALSLGLPDTATQEEINAKILSLMTKSEGTPISVFEMLAASRGVLTDGNKADLLKLYELDQNLALSFIDHLGKPATAIEPAAAPESVTLSSLLALVKNTDASGVKKNWESLTDAEKIKLRADNPATYKEMYASHYGFEPKIN